MIQELPTLTDVAGVGVFASGFCPYYSTLLESETGLPIQHVTVDGNEIRLESPTVMQEEVFGTLSFKLAENNSEVMSIGPITFNVLAVNSTITVSNE